MSKKFYFLLSLLCASQAGYAYAQEAPTKATTVAYTSAPVSLSQAAENTSALVIDTSKAFRLGTVTAAASAEEGVKPWRAAKKAANTTIASLVGEKTLMPKRTTGLLPAYTVTVSKVGTDSVKVSPFLFTDIAITAKVDEATGEIRFPVQTVAEVDGNTVQLCKYDPKRGVYSTTDEVKGTIADGDIFIEDAFGFFVTAGPSKGGYLTNSLIKYAVVATPNTNIVSKKVTYGGDGSMTAANRTVTSETTGGYVYQVASNKARVMHMPAGSLGYSDLLVNLNANGTVSIDPQTMYTVSPYGDVNSYAFTESTDASGAITVSAQVVSPISATYTAGTSSSKISWNKWLQAAYGTYKVIMGMYDGSDVTTSAKLVFPAKPTLDFEGEGTAESPYLIKTAKDLATLAYLSKNDASVRSTTSTKTVNDVTYRGVFTGKYFKLANDIDLAGTKEAIEPIGNTSYMWEGVFDGDGHTISNFSIDNYAYDYCGLFSEVGLKGEVKNLKMANTTITSLGYNVAAVAGRNYGKIDNITLTSPRIVASEGYNTGAVAGRSYGPLSNITVEKAVVSSLGYSGAVVGSQYSSITNANATGSVQGTGKQVFVGGVAGLVSKANVDQANPVIDNCSFSGTVVSPNNEVAVGGLVGSFAYGSLTNSAASATVMGISASACYVGGLAGTIYHATVNNCYTTGFVSNPNTPHCGGLVGKSSEYSETSGGSVITNSYSSAMLVTGSTASSRGLVGTPAYITLGSGCYYDAQIAGVNADNAKSTAFLTSGTAPEGYSADAWTVEAGVYPTLKSLPADFQAASAAAVVLNEADNVSQVKNNFTYSTAHDVVWNGVRGGQYTTDGGYAYKFNNGVGELNWEQYTDTLRVSKGNVSKNVILNIAPMPFEGAGTAENPWLIRTKDDLKNLSHIANAASINFEGKFLKQMANIDCEGDTIVPVCKDNAGKFAFLGTYDGGGYTIDNMVISTVVFYDETSTTPGNVNPKSADSYNYGGLFGNLGASGVVKNVTIGKNCVLDYFCYGGAIAGLSTGVIENCANYATVKVYFTEAGGIVGEVKAGGVVRNCFNGGNVYAGYTYAGGIAGKTTAAVIENCQNAGEVAAKFLNPYQADGKQYGAGGIVGSAAAGTRLVNVLNSGKVASYKQVGGIVAVQAATAAAPTKIVNGVNYGIVASTADVTTGGALVGVNTLGTFENALYDKQLQNVNGVGLANVAGTAGLNTADLASAAVALPDSAWTKADGIYPMLNFAKDNALAKFQAQSVVKFADGNSAAYVTSAAQLLNGDKLAWSVKKGTDFSVAGASLNVNVPAAGAVADTLVSAAGDYVRELPLTSLNAKILDGEGTEALPYLIGSTADWMKVSDFVASTGFDFAGAYFKVTADLDFAGTTFAPIGYNGKSFQADLNGDGHTIDNVTVNATEKTDVNYGLIGILGADGCVHDLTVGAGSSIKAYTSVGGVAGSAYGKVYNVKNYGEVATTGTISAGGVAGTAYEGSSFKNCANYGKVTAKTTNAGGVFGTSAAAASIAADSCYNYGEVTATTNYAGGVAGYGSVFANRCANYGKVTATTNYAAGIVGDALLPSGITFCHNEGEVTAKAYAAGIVALNVAHSNAVPFVIDSCYNAGTVSASTTTGYAAGVAGNMLAGTHITRCYNASEINTAGSYAAGIVAKIVSTATVNSSITDCYNEAPVTGNMHVGGILGHASVTGTDSTYMARCYNHGNITSTNATNAYVGGLGGSCKVFAEDCYNTGDVTGAGKYVGGIAGYNGSQTKQMRRVFNMGNVTGGSTDVGGIAGVGRLTIYDSYNFGTVTGSNNVGGILAQPYTGSAASFAVTISDCYNAGKIESSGANVSTIAAAYSGTRYYYEIVNAYADTTVTPLTAYDLKSTFGTPIGKSTREMMEADGISDQFELQTACYPSLKAFADNPYNNFCVASVLLGDGDTFDHVTKPIAIGALEGVEWAVSDNLYIVDGMVYAKAAGAGTITKTTGRFSRTYNVAIEEVTGVSEVTTSKAVANRCYYDLNGVRYTEKPAAAGIYVEQTVFTDGTTSAVKVLVK
ncbi:MAG: hypothetical protein Q4B68_05605 [Bacteroidales bacterium]|nr:hypothetical protein [Bacteroidales bacterium]